MLTLLLSSLLLQSGSLAFDAPTEWGSRPAASSMRVAEFVVPKAAGDPEDGEVIVYFFRGSGGGVNANIQRWLGQSQQPSGQAVADPGRSSFTVNALKVTTVDVSGAYVADVRPGAAQRHHKPNFRMRAAIVETPRGPYFIRFTGPASTVKAGSAAFDRFLKSLHTD